MAKTVVGLFDNFDEAQQAIQDIVDAGFPRDAINLVASDQKGNLKRYAGGDKGDDKSVPNKGTAAGAAIGGIAGLLVGLGALTIPGIGPVLAAGPLASALAGVGVGAVAGGLVGTLADMGVPKQHAELYSEGVRRGGTLVTVTAGDDRAGEVVDIMQRHNAVDIDRRSEEWRRSGWTPEQAGAQPAALVTDRDRAQQPGDKDLDRRDVPMHETARPTDVSKEDLGDRERRHVVANDVSNEDMSRRDYVAYEGDYHRNYDTRYAGSGYAFDQVEPAYRYGNMLANDERFANVDWNTMEPGVRQAWETQYPGTWERFKDAIRYGWDRVRGQG